jgi:predicted RNA-binding Zn-ribbon protein involved in translation (DUF1610 family)
VDLTKSSKNKLSSATLQQLKLIQQLQKEIENIPSTKIQSFDPNSPTASYDYMNNQTTVQQAVAVDDQDTKPVFQESFPPTAAPTMVTTSTGALQVQNGNNNSVAVPTRRPVQLTSCPNCGKQNVTTCTRTKATGITWVCVGVGVFVFWPLCWIPLVVDPMKQTNHYCQNCGVKVGRVKPFQA